MTNDPVTTSRLPVKPIMVLLFMASIWGAGWAVVKIGARDFMPLFMAGMRSAIAGLCLAVYMAAMGIPLFASRNQALHGAVTGLMFAAEFGLIYWGLTFTLASHMYILLYIAPFSAAIGAHFFLKNDRLNRWKTIGLILAFCGIVVLFARDLGALSLTTLPGDLMALAAGMIWGMTTVYTKKYLVEKSHPSQVLFYQLVFSIVPFFGVALLVEHPMIIQVTVIGLASLFYQTIIIAFLSYLVWMHLIRRYPVSLIHAFSFFTPCIGVFLSGAVMLGETITSTIIISLLLVSAGLVLVNR
jgi:drug/metabolite transporter (DMT)-like permease